MENTIKSKSALKTKDRRPYSQTENCIGKINKSQNEFPQQVSFDNLHNSPIKKALNEMNAIVKIGIEKDSSLYEKNAIILNSSETIENLRKNVLHLQMEYEKLDQNFQKEISQRSEISQRMDATKSLVESVLLSATHLGNSIKQLDNDKFHLAEFYELVYQSQKEADKKYETVEKLVKEQDMLVKAKFDEIAKVQEQAVSKYGASLAEINFILTQTEEKLKTTLSENKELLLRVEDLECLTKNLDLSVKNKQEVLKTHQENTLKLQSKMKHFKILKNKYSTSSKNMKKKILILKQKNNQLARHLSQTENSYRNSLVNNEAIKEENAQFKSEIEKLLESTKTEKRQLEIKYCELLQKINVIESEKEELHDFNTKTTEKVNELNTKYETEKTNRNELQEKYCEVAKENQQLKLISEDLSNENDKKTVLICDLKEQVLKWENNFNSKVEFYEDEMKNFQNLVNESKEKITDLEEKLSFANTARQNVLLDYDAKLMDNQKLKEKIDHLTQDLQQSVEKIELVKAENTEKSFLITSLESQVNTLKGIASDKEKDLHQLQEECQNMKIKNNEFNKFNENLNSQNRSLQFELDRVKVQNLDLNEKLVNEQSLTLTVKSNLEKHNKNLKEELELEKKLREETIEIKKNLEKELNEMKKVMDENFKLKSSTKNLKNRLEEAEAKIEAYKVIVRKLETEKADEENHSLEISRQKLELTRLQEIQTANEGPTIVEKTSRNFNNNQSGEKETSMTRNSSRSKKPDFELFKRNDSKFLSPSNKNISASPQAANKKVAASTPKSTPNKLISLTPQSTPRKIFTSKSGSQSTPKKKFPPANFTSAAQTPDSKKKDPYNFDSDDSNETFDSDQVLRLFGPRQKKQHDRKQKTKK